MPSMPPPSAVACTSGASLATMPALKEIAGDLVADLHAPNLWTDFNHLTGPIRQRHEVVGDRHTIRSAHDAEIAEVERAGRDLNQNLAMAGLPGSGRLTWASASMPAPPLAIDTN